MKIGFSQPCMKYLYAYRNIAVPSSLITFFCCYHAWMSNTVTALSLLFWVKVITSLILIGYIQLFKSELATFFMNLGMGRLRFYISIFAIDIGIFFVLTVLVLQLR